MPHQPASPALARFTVLDLTRVRAGPTCVRQLADWGADVIKIEMPAADADSGPGGPRDGSDFQNLHRNKRSMTLNLKAAEGRAIFLRLVERADVVVENYRPDVKGRLGIAYDDLKAVNPKIVLASISGFGQDGPYAKRPGFDQIAQGMGGLMSITGLPGQGPVRVGIPVADLCAGLFAAQAILVALLEREVSGEGQWVQTSLLQAQVFMLDFQAARWLVSQEVPPQTGNEHPTSVPTNLYPTKDGAVNIAVSGETIWRRFAEALGHAEWIEDARFADQYTRKENRDALNAAIAEATREWTSHDLVETLIEKGVPSGPAYSVDEVFADPQVKHLKMAADIETLPFGATQLVGQPIAMSRTNTAMVSHPPDRGEHTDEILAELGLDGDDIAALRERDII